MFRSALFGYSTLFIGALLILPLRAIAQNIPTLSFSSLQYSRTNVGGLSQPISASFFSNCITLQTGLALYHSAKNSGIFLADCRTQDSLYSFHFLFYPNPVFSQATLSISRLVPHQSLQLQLVDVLGRIILNQVISFASLYSGYKFNFSQLVPGVYFLVISNSEIHKVIKFIKS